MAKGTTRLRLDKDALFERVHYEPHAGQRAVHESKAPRRVLACGVRWGKSRCAAMEGIAAALAPADRSMGWIAAPTYDLCEKVYREIVIVAAEHLRHRIITLRESEKRLLIRNLTGGVGEIRCKSADNPVSLLGEGLDWLIVDEAAQLKPSVWQGYLSQRLVDRKGWALLISTPRGKGWFYDMWQRGQGRDQDYESWNQPSWNNPHLDRELIEAERNRLPERTFAVEYMGAFIEGAGAVFRNVRECAVGSLQEPSSGESYYAGLDLAKLEDFTVCVIVNAKREVVAMDRFQRLDWDLQVTRIKALLDRYNRARVLVDSTGKGEPIYEALWKSGCNAQAYPFTQKSKAALVDNLSLLLEKRAIVLPRPELHPELIHELEAFEFTTSDAGNLRSSAPPGQHDDTVCALALAGWLVRNEPGPPSVVRAGPPALAAPLRARRGLRPAPGWVRLRLR